MAPSLILANTVLNQGTLFLVNLVVVTVGLRLCWVWLLLHRSTPGRFVPVLVRFGQKRRSPMTFTTVAIIIIVMLPTLHSMWFNLVCPNSVNFCRQSFVLARTSRVAVGYTFLSSITTGTTATTTVTTTSHMTATVATTDHTTTYAGRRVG
jgi:hypothetical protein